MAQATSNSKIDELRLRLKTDPKSRLFYPLAEELRKANQSTEAEQVLRSGLTVHPTYLSAWVSLGRVLREQRKYAEAVEVLSKALQIDPGNVVVARLLADAYLEMGEKVEAIKKYKLVHALLPTDQDVAAIIERIERELNPPQPATLSVADEEAEIESGGVTAPRAESSPFASESVVADVEAQVGAVETNDEPSAIDDNPFAAAEAAQEQELRVETATADVEPMLAAHEESPFEEPATAYSSAAFEIEAPEGMHEARAPLAADLPYSITEDEQLSPPDAAVFAPQMPLDDADVFAPAEPAPVPEAEDVANTITMADLYARQGLVDDAQHIYETILARDPQNDGVRAKLEALHVRPVDVAEEEAPVADLFDSAPATGGKQQKIDRLENWLAKMTRRELGRV